MPHTGRAMQVKATRKSSSYFQNRIAVKHGCCPMAAEKVAGWYPRVEKGCEKVGTVFFECFAEHGARIKGEVSTSFLRYLALQMSRWVMGRDRAL